MAKHPSVFVKLPIVFFLALHSSAAQTANIQASVSPADGLNLAPMRRNVHPFARPEFDEGPVADNQVLGRLLLLLQRRPEQEIALKSLLNEQQDTSSTNFHAWLTPEQFGKQFGPSDADVRTAVQWLASQGFTGIRVSGGWRIEFSQTLRLTSLHGQRIPLSKFTVG